MGLGEKIAKARRKTGLSQEQLADFLQVSRQAVQKWESDMSVPQLDKLITLSRRFNISLDSLLDNEPNVRNADERVAENRPCNYTVLDYRDTYSEDFVVEYQQLWDEGFDIGKYKKMAVEVPGLPETKESKAIAENLASLMMKESMRKDYKFYEPCNLEEIKCCRKQSGVALAKGISKTSIRKKVKGAWLGRVAGCLLGKPIEGMKKDELNFFLKETNNYPIHRYVKKSDLNEELYGKLKHNLREREFAMGDMVDGMPIDDDTTYTILAAKLIKEKGRGFSSDDILKAWTSWQTKDKYYTAELRAYINYINGYESPNTAVYKNPYREWIGAQIRGDYFGYINPGDPEAAAEMAYRDASVSHIKNGIYGEMFVSAMLAAAAACNDVRNVIMCGLAEIPSTSRLYDSVMELIGMYDSGKSVEECKKWIYKQYDDNNLHHWCHTISNALIVVMSLLYGKKDFSSTICLAVGCGFDTDCNGATAGSILGMILGDDGIPDKWTSCFKKGVETGISGYELITIDDFCDLAMSHLSSDFNN